MGFSVLTFALRPPQKNAIINWYTNFRKKAFSCGMLSSSGSFC